MKCKHTSTVTLFTHTALKKPNSHPATRQCKLIPQTTPSTPRRRDTEVGRARGKPHRLCSSHSCLSSSSSVQALCSGLPPNLRLREKTSTPSLALL